MDPKKVAAVIQALKADILLHEGSVKDFNVKLSNLEETYNKSFMVEDETFLNKIKEKIKTCENNIKREEANLKRKKISLKQLEDM